MRKLAYILLVVAIGMLSSCSLLEHRKQADAVVSVGGEVLTQDQLDAITRGTTAADSAQLAEAYIHQWVCDVLEAEKASKNRNDEIERLVDNYRRDLYMHAYQEHIVKQRMEKSVPDTLIEAFYNEHEDMFVLDDHIIKGLLLVIPNGAPDLPKLRKWLGDPAQEIEKIEKYAYQHATGYELFTELWRTGNQIRLTMPFSQQELTNALKQKKQIEVQDSLQTYILQVTDKHLLGEKMPIDYAQPEIKKILLQERQAEFLQANREELYEEADKLFRIKR